MVKYFCDICGAEMSDQDRGRIKIKRGRVSLEIMTALDNVWNNGQICHSCIVDVVFAYGERSPSVSKLDPDPVITFFPIDPSEEDKRMFETVEAMRRELSEVLAGKGRIAP